MIYYKGCEVGIKVIVVVFRNICTRQYMLCVTLCMVRSNVSAMVCCDLLLICHPITTILFLLYTTTATNNNKEKHNNNREHHAVVFFFSLLLLLLVVEEEEEEEIENQQTKKRTPSSSLRASFSLAFCPCDESSPHHGGPCSHAETAETYARSGVLGL